MLRNIVRFALVSGFAAVFTFFGKLVIGLGTAFICYFILTTWTEVKDKLYSYIIPTIVPVLLTSRPASSSATSSETSS